MTTTADHNVRIHLQTVKAQHKQHETTVHETVNMYSNSILHKMHLNSIISEMQLTTQYCGKWASMHGRMAPPMGDRLGVAVELMGSEDPADSAF